jgi:hypothetical protein
MKYSSQLFLAPSCTQWARAAEENISREFVFLNLTTRNVQVLAVVGAGRLGVFSSFLLKNILITQG